MTNTNLFRLTRAALPLLAGGLFVSALAAHGPNGTPEKEGTIKAAVGVEAGLFARQMKLIEDRRGSWLAKAAQATPKLSRTTMKPVAVVTAKKDATSFQGWKMVASGKPESVCNKPLSAGRQLHPGFRRALRGAAHLLAATVRHSRGCAGAAGVAFWRSAGGTGRVLRFVFGRADAVMEAGRGVQFRRRAADGDVAAPLCISLCEGHASFPPASTASSASRISMPRP